MWHDLTGERLHARSAVRRVLDASEEPVVAWSLWQATRRSAVMYVRYVDGQWRCRRLPHRTLPMRRLAMVIRGGLGNIWEMADYEDEAFFALGSLWEELGKS